MLFQTTDTGGLTQLILFLNLALYFTFTFGSSNSKSVFANAEHTNAGAYVSLLFAIWVHIKLIFCPRCRELAARSPLLVSPATSTLTTINLQINKSNDGEEIRDLLNASISSIGQEISAKGAGFFPLGVWDFYNRTSKRVIWVRDLNKDSGNHRSIRRSVLSDGVKAILEYMTEETAEHANFTILDEGGIEVGIGSVG